MEGSRPKVGIVDKLWWNEISNPGKWNNVPLVVTPCHCWGCFGIPESCSASQTTTVSHFCLSKAYDFQVEKDFTQELWPFFLYWCWLRTLARCHAWKFAGWNLLTPSSLLSLVIQEHQISFGSGEGTALGAKLQNKDSRVYFVQISQAHAENSHLARWFGAADVIEGTN